MLPVRDRLTSAFRRAYESAGLSQEVLAEYTGIRQATISKYARGETTPPLDFLAEVEDACQLTRGHILRLAGFVDDAVDLEAAALTDPDIDDDIRPMLVDLIRYARRVPTVAAGRAKAAERVAAITTGPADGH